MLLLRVAGDRIPSYPCDSPQAAVRIGALSLLADSNSCKSERVVLASQGAPAQLGRSPAELHDVVRDLCRDMLATSDAACGGSSRIDRRTLSARLAEVRDPDLQLKMLKLYVAVVESDQHAAEGESTVLAAALTQWGLPLTRPQGTQPTLLDA